MKSLIEIIDSNKKKTKWLLSSFIFLFGAFGALVGLGLSFIIDQFNLKTISIISLSFILIALIYSSIAYYFMNKAIQLRSHSYEIRENDDPEFYHIVEDMALISNIPMPRVFIMEDPSPNAFAAGRDPEHAMIVITTGLRSLLSREELEGVVAHEAAHIKNYDIRIASIVIALISFLVGSGAALVTVSWTIIRIVVGDSRNKITAAILAISFISLIFGWTIRLVGIPLAKIIQFALSREREYLADATAASLTQNPTGLISALRKIEKVSEPGKLANSALSALYISQPLKKDGKRTFFSKLYNSHPDTADRISRLESLM